MLDLRIFKNPDLIKLGVNSAFKYLSDKYGFKSISDDSLNNIKNHFESDQYVIVSKEKILIYASWNIYEGINFYISEKNEELYPNKNLSMLKADLVEQESDESYADYIQRCKDWIKDYRDLKLLNNYKINNPSKYVEYYLLTEIKIIETNFPDIFEKGEYPN